MTGRATVAYAPSSFDLSRNGRRIIVRKNEGHPESYLFIDIDEKRYFLCSIEKGWTRGHVRAAAEEWPRAHPQHWR